MPLAMPDPVIVSEVRVPVSVAGAAGVVGDQGVDAASAGDNK